MQISLLFAGRVPFIHIGPFLVSEMEPIIACVQTRVRLKLHDQSIKKRVRSYKSSQSIKDNTKPLNFFFFKNAQ